MVKLESYGTITAGKLHIIHADKFKNDITLLKDGRYKLTLEKTYRKRSNTQNSFYHGVVIPLVFEGLKEAGFDNFTKEKTHNLLKFKFLKVEEVSSNGEVLEIVKSTSSLTTTEFMEFISDIQKFASEFLSIYIPNPGEEMEIKFNENEIK